MAAAPIIRRVKKYLDGFEGEFYALKQQQAFAGRNNIAPISAATEIATEVGIPRGTFYKIKEGLTENIPFDLADRLLCAIGTPLAWHEPDLIGTYVSVNLAAIDERESALAVA